MAIRVTLEKIRADRQTITAPYWVDTDDGAALNFSAAQTAAISQFNTDFGFPATDWPAERLSDSVVRVTIVYSPSEIPQSDPPVAPPLGGYAVPTTDYEFFFQAKPLQIKHGIAHVYNTVDARPFGTKLNVVNEAGQIKYDGANIPVPPVKHKLRYVAPNAVITGAYQTLMEDLCGCVNSVAFRGRAIGEVMLVAASGAKRTNADWELSFEFATGVTLPNPTTIDGVSFLHAIRPFDYAWVYSDIVAIPVAGEDVLVLSGRDGYVEQVWPYKDLNLLSLP